MGLGIIRVGAKCKFEMDDRVVNIPLFPKHGTEVVMGFDKVRMDPYGMLIVVRGAKKIFPILEQDG